VPTALVTGGNRGIGLEVVRQLAARGYDVVMGSRGPATAPDGVRVARLDVADPDSIAALALDRCDVLVNNAAIHYDTYQRAANADLRVVEEALDVNLLGAWRMTQALLPLLRRSAHGRVVNVSSGAGSITTMTGGPPAYSVSKAALNALTRLLAADLRPILVNAVCPGWVATDMGGSGGRPVSEGAAGIVWAATLPDDGPTGGFFRDGRPIDW
jgi:NAD(P)-dependent dehydrogenase (short-subunit alcohol dehydrogenase family)